MVFYFKKQSGFSFINLIKIFQSSNIHIRKSVDEQKMKYNLPKSTLRAHTNQHMLAYISTAFASFTREYSWVEGRQP
ncbi:CLUMA_CG000393, isoform A [Clunio marinus]|uniref:CLUMA_CG000393, isoform A n=1 Tax=Clunio marinus TaxID=568069 RepID=A0A1J1HEM4_9DIPT|nr:CLUMA_CG000393, isoform A [Clunio marinus]